MRLQTLEIKGFKSFAKDTVIHFNENVTGIVGPNGAGKSNIIDAIRWVLGEQKSKELRLAKMQDVIFNGTNKRKKANTAEVSITFENTKGILPSEYHMIKVSRVLYRSGESEYRLNDISCRLKDIKDLLIDTGIGSNSYAIIELGMVDDILHDKDSARRKMFEQAAGISKYKSRKREALSKLSLTQTDLDRVEDLLFEINGNLKGLEKQAKRAKKYLELREKYKDLSLVFHAIKINALRDEYISIEKQISAFNVRYIELRAVIDRKESSLQKEKLKNINDEKQLGLFQQKISSITDDIRKLESRKEILQKEISFSGEKVKGLEHRSKVLQEKQKDLNGKIALLKDKVSLEKLKEVEFDKDYDTSTMKYQNLQIIYEDNKSQVEKKEQEKVELDKRQLSVEKELAICSNKIQQAENTINYLNDKAKELKRKSELEGKILSTTQTDLTRLQSKLSDLQKSDEDKKAKLDTLRDSIDDKRTVQRGIQRKRDVKLNEIDLLESMINKLEGFPESIKFLHKEWKKKQVLLSDIISCEDENRPSVELVMSDYLDYFVVEKIDDALEAISMLKTAQRGKARFFILDRITSLEKESKPELTSMQSIVQCEEKYKKLISYILYETYLIQADEKSMLEKYPNLSLVAHDGSFISRNGQLMGGSVSVFEGKKIGRKKKLVKLIEDKKVLDADLQQATSVIDRLEREKTNLSQKDYRQEIKSVSRDVEQKSRELYKLQASSESINNQLAQQQNSLDDQSKSIASNKAKLKDFELEKATVEKGLELLIPELGHKGKLNELTEQLSLFSKEMNESQILKIKQNNLVDNLNQEQHYNTEKYNETKAEIEAVSNSIIREIERQEKREIELRSIKKELEKAYVIRKTEQSDLGGIEQSYFDAKHRITEEENALRALSKEFSDLQSKINSFKDKTSDLKFKIQGIKQRVNIEFTTNIDSVEFEIPEGYVVAEQELQIEKMQNRLSNFGDINPMAVEAYNEMEERKLNIELQRDDIKAAKLELVATMQEIESTATKLFLESFEQARKHFVTVFRSLFTQDDDCDLILLDPDNPLKSGIEIIAKPKGKRPQSLSQLSGGEKTLTASALLFSLYLLKPAPFCIFDEVDAPLDDQNVQKFTNIIRAFSQESQFLVVTHNKATMAELDVLYGVYMEEKGVSSVSQVDFRNYDHSPIMAEAVI